MTGDVNLGFFAKDAVAAGVKIPLLNYLTTLQRTYRQVRENVGTFKCGAFVEHRTTSAPGRSKTAPLRADDDAGGDTRFEHMGRRR